MGTGTYSSDFHGTGKTFIVDGPLARQEDFDAHVKQCEAEVMMFQNMRIGHARNTTISTKTWSTYLLIRVKC